MSLIHHHSYFLLLKCFYPETEGESSSWLLNSFGIEFFWNFWPKFLDPFLAFWYSKMF